MTEPVPTPSDAVAQPLHLKSALGQQLTPEERTTLDAWYAHHDREEAAMFASSAAAQAQQRADILAVLARIRSHLQQNQRQELREDLRLLERLLKDQG